LCKPHSLSVSSHFFITESQLETLDRKIHNRHQESYYFTQIESTLMICVRILLLLLKFLILLLQLQLQLLLLSAVFQGPLN